MISYLKSIAFRDWRGLSNRYCSLLEKKCSAAVLVFLSCFCISSPWKFVILVRRYAFSLVLGILFQMLKKQCWLLLHKLRVPADCFSPYFVWLNKMAGACTGGRSTSQTYFKIIHQVKTLNIITAVCMSRVKLVRFLPFRFHRFLVSSRVLFRYMKQLDTQYFEFLHKTSLLLCCVSWRTCSLRLMYPLNVFHKKFSFREVIKAQKKFRFQRLVLISFSHYLAIEGNV